VGWGKSGVLEHKSDNISETHVDEKLLWRAYRSSPTLFRTVPSPTPTASSSPRLRVRSPHSKIQNSNSYYLRNGWSYGLQLWPEHSHGPPEQKPIKNFGEKEGSVGVSRNCIKFLSAPIISGTVKLRTSNFVRAFIGAIRTEDRYKFRKK